MSRRLLLSISLMIGLATCALADETEPAPEAKPQWQRLLEGDDAKKATDLGKRISAAENADNYADAIQLHEELLAFRTAVQGADHWETVGQKWALDAVRKIAALPVERRAGLRSASEGYLKARQLEALGEYLKAEPFWREFRRVCEETFSPKHPSTAISCNGLAYNLHQQGKYDEAQPIFQQALDVFRDCNGQDPITAISYGMMARNLHAQGRYADAEVLFQKALDLNRNVNGENNPATATSYDDLGANLMDQGRCAEAQPVLEKALDLRRALLGNKHPNTAFSFYNLARNFSMQGRYAESHLLHQTALDIRRELLGDEHPDTARSYNSVAGSLMLQEKYAEAQPLFERALDVQRKLLGDKHPLTSVVKISVAHDLARQRKFDAAQRLLEEVYNLRREALGEKHPHVAYICGALAQNLEAQGKYADAEPLYQKGLDLSRELLGEKHFVTAAAYDALGRNLGAQAKHTDAQRELVSAAAAYEAARLNVAAARLDRAIYGARSSPYNLLAAVEARLGSPMAAWQAAESNLARAFDDERAFRSGVTFAAEEHERRMRLNDRLSALQPRIVQLVSKQAPTNADQEDLRRFRKERSSLESDLADLAATLSRRELASRNEVQAALAYDAAIILWVDVADTFGVLQEHWGCVVRTSGEPIWERLPGTGPERSWTNHDATLSKRLLAAVTEGKSLKEIAVLAQAFHAQRIAPLEKHLDGVTRLFVVPVNAVAGVPVELLTDKYTVSYVPSGTFVARMKEQVPSTGSSLLALGDAVYPSVEPSQDPAVPPGGLLIANVVPESNGQEAGLRRDDVLLKYAGVELSSVEQLSKLIEGHAQDKSVAITIWRDGEMSDHELPPGKLGVQLERQPAQLAIAEKSKTEQMLRAIERGGEWPELPGTAVEVARLKVLAGNSSSTILTRSAASEQELERLRASGKLDKFRYLHFAAHGEPNNARSFESALILSQDNISDNIPIGGGKYYDGRLTANEVLENWRLNADLVTLSACESALGRPGGGDGLLGFAQAFLLAGARAVCLSQWKVDDTATVLLMERFYQNLLGKRDELSKPLGKADSLAEAKHWLRNLTDEEATKLVTDMMIGVSRGKGEAALKLVVTVGESSPKPFDRPFAHPRYWAAFILIGDPD